MGSCWENINGDSAEFYTESVCSDWMLLVAMVTSAVFCFFLRKSILLESRDYVRSRDFIISSPHHRVETALYTAESSATDFWVATFTEGLDSFSDS